MKDEEWGTFSSLSLVSGFIFVYFPFLLCFVFVFVLFLIQSPKYLFTVKCFFQFKQIKVPEGRGSDSSVGKFPDFYVGVFAVQESID